MDQNSPSSPSPAPGAAPGVTLAVNCDDELSLPINYYFPFPRSIRVANMTGKTLSDARVRVLAKPAFMDGIVFDLPPLKPGQIHEATAQEMKTRLDRAFFGELRQNQTAYLNFQLFQADELLDSSARAVTLFPNFFWPGLDSYPESLLYFIHPKPMDSLLEETWARRGESAPAEPAIMAYRQGPEGAQALARTALSVWRDQNFSIGAGDPFIAQKARAWEEILAGDASREISPLEDAIFLCSLWKGVGLRSLVVFANSGIFAGVWLVESQFPSALSDDPEPLARKIAAGEILLADLGASGDSPPVLEESSARLATLLGPDNFRALLDRERGRTEIDDRSPFPFILDLPPPPPLPAFALPRGSGALFLPSELPQGSGALFSPSEAEAESQTERDGEAAARAAETAPPAATKARSPLAPGKKETLAARSKLEKWKRKLLDLSLRNNLLNFRPTLKSLEFVAPDPEDLEDRVSAGDKFTPVAGADKLRDDPERLKGDDGKPLSADAAYHELAQELAPQNALVAKLAGAELVQRLTNIQRKAKADLEEGGANTLYLAFGFLKWRSARHPKFAKAPLILKPVKLERQRSGATFTLKATEDEPRFNLTLLELLRKDYGIGVLDRFAAELPTDRSGLDVYQIWDETDKAIAAFPEWSVLREVTLGLFSFSKYLMFEDLERQKTNIARSRLANLLMYRETLPESGAGLTPPLEPGELDEKLAPESVFTPLLADSSQLSAVARSAGGSDYVLIGPPGTGKSQTIANIIAHNLGLGRSVLFVAEKAAALNVVYRRLRDLKLDEFCLQLHSNKTDKKAVSQRLYRTLNDTAPSAPPRWESVPPRLAATRAALNAYVRELHAPYPSGFSARRAIGELACRGETPDIEPDFLRSDAPLFDGAALERTIAASEKFGRLARALKEELASGVVLISRRNWTHEWETETLSLAKAVIQDSEALNELAETVKKAIGLDLALFPLQTVPGLTALWELAPLAHGRDYSFSLGPDSEAESRALARASDAARRFRAKIAEFRQGAEEGSDAAAFRAESISLARELSQFWEREKGAARTARERAQFETGIFLEEKAKRLWAALASGPESLAVAWRAFAAGRGELTLAKAQKALELLRAYDAAVAGLAFRHDLDIAFGQDLESLKETYQSAMGSVWGLWKKWKVGAALKTFLIGKPEELVLADLTLLGEARAIDLELARLGRLRESSGGLFKGRLTDRAGLSRFIEVLETVSAAYLSALEGEKNLGEAEARLALAQSFNDNLRDILKASFASPELAASLKEPLRLLLDNKGAAMSPTGALAGTLKSWSATAAKLSALASKLESAAGGASFGPLSFAKLESFSRDVVRHAPSLREYALFLEAKSDALGLGLGSILERMERGALRLEEVGGAVIKAFARALIPRAVETSPSLKSFALIEKENQIQSFRTLGKELRETSVAKIRLKLLDKSRFVGIPAREINVLNAQFAKKRAHFPIRKLLGELPHLLPLLTPCLLTSPLSVAQYLPDASQLFDLVVFDEASQIPVWDAIGAIARGRQAVVVGDPKQLPPTNFFQRTDDESQDGSYEDEDEDERLEESVLDECVAAGLSQVKLSWHYRSRSESLISFSNRKYYDGDLVTFPSPDTRDLAVSFRQTPGVYDRGATKTNKLEAEILVADVIKTLKSPEFRQKKLSLGVVTFNGAQQNLIEDLLEEARRLDPALEEHFEESRDEPVLVKNLENIQGDERDYIYFSVCYGPDKNGKLALNFGPLNNIGGERRLNVAITRARRALKVFASFEPDALSLNKSPAKGMEDLRDFMRFAAGGAARGSERREGSYDADPGLLENFVAQSLGRLGWNVVRGVGVSDFQIDLAVVDPDNPARFLAGLEGDGETYRRAKTALDRDYLREKVLADLGWTILRFWAPDWWRDPAAAARALDSALKDILARRVSAPSEAEAPAPAEGAGASGDGDGAIAEDGAAGADGAAAADGGIGADGGDGADAPASAESAGDADGGEADEEDDEDSEEDEVTEVREDDGDSGGARASGAGQGAARGSSARGEGGGKALSQAETNAKIRERIRETVVARSPVYLPNLASDVARFLGWSKATAKLRAQVKKEAQKLFPHTVEKISLGGLKREPGYFFWSSEPGRLESFRARGEDEKLNILEVALPELVALARGINPQSWEDPVELMKEKLKILRLNKDRRERLELAWRTYVEEEKTGEPLK